MTTLALPTNPPTVASATAEVIRADGDLYLAAERLGMSREDLLATIASDTEGASSLAAQLRILNMVQVWGLINTTKDALVPVIPELKPSELARTYTSLIAAFATVSDKQTLQLLQSVTTNVGIQLVPWAVGPDPQEPPTILELQQENQEATR